MPGRDEVRAHADVDHLPVGERLFPERLRLGQVFGQREGVVDQDVEPALLALDLLEQRGDLIVVGMVDLDRDALAAAAVDFRRGLADGAGQLVRCPASRCAR